MWFVLHRSVYGRYLMAVGRNEQAARFSGINTRVIISSSYVLMGLLAGVAAILFAFYTNSVSPSTHGNFFELYGIAAAVLSLLAGDIYGRTPIWRTLALFKALYYVNTGLARIARLFSRPTRSMAPGV